MIHFLTAYLVAALRNNGIDTPMMAWLEYRRVRKMAQVVVRT